MRRALFIFLAFLTLLGIYFGAALLFFKTYYFTRVSSTFIEDHRYWSFIEASERALSFSSPIGHEETLYLLGYQTLSLLDTDVDEEVARALVTYYESWFDVRQPFSGGVFYTQGFSVAGQLRERLWDLYGATDDFSKAEYYYLKGLALAPDKPDFLYDLFRLYLSHSAFSGDVRAVGGRILGLWPDDIRVQGILKSLE
ncbi:MAG: hypothetical protein A3F24_00930 [Candidatus Colwellbacteria bacterium RIFCSPHIGHO2_12_FULL_44_17]|uniref:Tetratricopeptide repeat-like domain-containing protein n=2 Tax=Candidatus Colwelliibacteriota TaxID=1817904 RepID=A0A1G1Z6W4_9BACT|nr:MAG: hypothetical protein A3I31_01225 [Candidatus Colwellbacteria bacterium RIFCSPLOWO2_02_FULL_44_20b]OGY60269.1 MAG: hypothetical protein A3F24_00930 [Candidatus Colwellbacteria bacterium RIFCSPHIGHO2_12_FULL_44_17]